MNMFILVFVYYFDLSTFDFATYFGKKNLGSQQFILQPILERRKWDLNILV